MTAAHMPAVAVTLDGTRLTSAEAGVVSLETRLTLRGAHDALDLVAWRRSKLTAARPGSTFSVEIDDETVWTGEVVGVKSAGEALALEGLSLTRALSRERVSRVYAAQSVADVVRDLASSVDEDEISADTQLESYVVDDVRPVWEHLRDLARLVGADLGSSGEGKLRFVPPRTGSADAELRFGADLLSYVVDQAEAPKAAKIAAYGAGSEAGTDKWHWLLRVPEPAGPGEGTARVLAAARTRDAAEAFARARSDRARRSGVHAELVLRGDAALRPASLVELAELPDDQECPALRLVDVVHRLDALRGFVTRAVAEAAEATP
jgi:hypothetical protein